MATPAGLIAAEAATRGLPKGRSADRPSTATISYDISATSNLSTPRRATAQSREPARLGTSSPTSSKPSPHQPGNGNASNDAHLIDAININRIIDVLEPFVAGLR